MAKEEIAGVLETIATPLELKGKKIHSRFEPTPTPRARSKRLAQIFRIFRMKKRSRKFRGGGAVRWDEAANWISAFPEDNDCLRALRELLNLSNDGKRWSGGQIMDKILFQLGEQNQKGQKSGQDGRAHLEP